MNTSIKVLFPQSELLNIVSVETRSKGTPCLAYSFWELC